MQNNQSQIPTNWPFPIVNSERTKESQELINKKVHTKTKPDVSDIEEALL